MKQSDIQLAAELRTVVTRLIKKLRKHSAVAMSLSLTERSTMALLDEHGQLLPNELASMEKITSQSMSQILNHLLELGYINRQTAENDKRKSNISLSEKGTAALKQMRSERDSWLLQAIMTTCSPEEIERLKRALVPMRKLVDFDDV